MDETRQASQHSANEIFAAATEEQRARAKRVAAERVAQPTVVSRERVAYGGVALFAPVFAAALLINVLGFSPWSLFESKPTPEAARLEAQQLLDTLVADIEAFRTDTSHLPATLVEVGIPARGDWTYINAGNGGFRIEGTLYGETVTFTGAPVAASGKEGR